MVDLEQAVKSLSAKFTRDIREFARRAAISILDTSMPAPRARRSRATGGKRSPSDLDELASRFAEFVSTTPGLRIEQINARLMTKTKDLALPIRKLVASGVVVTKGNKRSTKYYPGKK